jgi:hypothetical protein
MEAGINLKVDGATYGLPVEVLVSVMMLGNSTGVDLGVEVEAVADSQSQKIGRNVCQKQVD